MLHRALSLLSSIKKRALGWLGRIVFSAALLAHASVQAQAPLQPFTVQLSWTHQTQFAGFYMAQRGRFFEAEGLDVRLLPGNASDNPLDMLRDRRADVAIATLRGAIAFIQGGHQVTNISQTEVLHQHFLESRPKGFSGRWFSNSYLA